MAPDLTTLAVPFLIEIGRFVRDELQRRWIAQSKTQSNNKVDLSNSDNNAIKSLFQNFQLTRKDWLMEIGSHRFELIKKIKLALLELEDAYIKGKILQQHYILQKDELTNALRENITVLKDELETNLNLSISTESIGD